MLPHEVVRQVNSAVVQPGARPHSRQIQPTTRANGRFTTNTGANVRRAFEEERPMISKAQVLRELTAAQQSAGGGPPLASTPPPAVRGMLARNVAASQTAPRHNSYSAAGHGNNTTQSPLTPTRPLHMDKSHANDRAHTPPRLLGKTLINSANVLPDEIAAKAALLTTSGGGVSTSVVQNPAKRRLSQTTPARDMNNNAAADFEVSLDKTSPFRARKQQSPARATPAMVEDEVVLPGSTLYRSAPDRSGFKPHTVEELAKGGRAPSPLAGARPLTPAATTMPVHSPSKGVRAMQLVQAARTSDSTALSLAAVSPSSSSKQQGRAAASDLKSREAPVTEAEGFCMEQLLASYGVTEQDLIPSDAAFVEEGCSVLELAVSEGIEVNLKTMPLDYKSPANTFSTLVAPKMVCNDNVWILCTPGTGNQTRSVAVIGGGNAAAAGSHSNSPTKGAAAGKASVADASHGLLQHHIIIDLSEWPMIDHGPSVIIPAFQYRAEMEDHLIDRCLQYHVTSSNESLFACSTPIVADSERGMLTLVPNPGACGSTTLSVFIEDNSSVDPETGLAMRSAVTTVYVHTMRTENTAANPAANGDGTPHPPLSASLPPESLAKIIAPTPSLYNAVPITAKAVVVADPQSGATAFLPDPVSLAAPPTNLHTPYVFPNPNLFKVREDSCLRDQLQGLLERTQAAAFDDANNSDLSRAGSSSGRLDCAFPFSTVVAPCYDSIANPFELLSSLYSPYQWRASSSTAPLSDAAVAAIHSSIDEAALSERLKTLLSSSSADEAAAAEVCALLERVAVLRQIDGGVAGQNGALEALEMLARRRAEQLGFANMAEIGEKDAILQTGKVKSKDEEAADVLLMSEQLVDALLKASRCFAHYGRFMEALEAAETAAKAAEKFVGKDSSANLAALLQIGIVNGQRGDFVGAAKSLEVAVDIADMVSGSGSATTAIIVMLLATAYCQYGDVSTGISCLQRACRAFTTILASRSESASAVASTPALLTADIKLRLALSNGYASYWKVLRGIGEDGSTPFSIQEGEVLGAIGEMSNSITAAEDAIYHHEQEGTATARIPAGLEDEALSPSGRSVVLSLLNTLVGALYLTRREGKAIDHYEAAAQLLGKASEEEENESQEASETAAASGDASESMRAAAAAGCSNPTRLSSLKVFAAIVNASVVCARITSNDMFNEANSRAVESSLETVEGLAGERHPFYCRLVALLGQLTRFSDDVIAVNVHVTLLRTREELRSIMCVPSFDAAIIASSCALTSLQQANVLNISGPEKAKRLRLAVNFALEAVDTIGACDELFGNTVATEHVLEHVVEPACLAVFCAVQEPLPTLLVTRLEQRIAAIRAAQGDTSLRLMEPLTNFGFASYLQGNYQSAHHFLSKALKVADTINLIFLLGHLFKPAVHLTASQAQERNRVAGDRLQIHQSVQFATILYAIAGVYVAQGNADDAQSTYLQAQAALELAHMQTSLATGVILASLSEFLYSEGHYGDALAHAEKAYNLFREFHCSVGSDSHNHYSVVPTAGKIELDAVERLTSIINERTRSKGYLLSKQYDGRHRFVVYL